MSKPVPRIDWIEDDQAEGQLAEVYGFWKSRNNNRAMPAVLKAFSHRADFLKAVMDGSYALHFGDGHLTWRQKEMLATFVSGLNECHY